MTWEQRGAKRYSYWRLRGGTAMPSAPIWARVSSGRWQPLLTRFSAFNRRSKLGNGVKSKSIAWLPKRWCRNCASSRICWSGLRWSWPGIVAMIVVHGG